MTGDATPFDRRAVRVHRDRAARRAEAALRDGRDPEFLHQEIADRLVDRLAEVRRPFADILDLGCRHGALARALASRPGAERVVQADLSEAMARSAQAANRFFPTLVLDEEALPFAPASFDLVTACLSLHWVNDLPGALIQIRRALKPDGLFLGAAFGGGTLRELREALVEAEIEVEGGAGPRVSPLLDVRDAGDLLQRAGFALPVVDRDVITVTYEHAFSLMHDLRLMGETNALNMRRRTATRRETMVRAAARYLERFVDKAGRLPATFEIVYLTGWAPDPSQPQPLKPGSAAARLADALGTKETKIDGDD